MNANQLPLGLKNESGVVFVGFFSPIFFNFLFHDGYVIYYSASSRIYHLYFPSSSRYDLFHGFLFCFVVFPWNVICELKELVEDYTFNSAKSIWKIRFSNCTCKQTCETSQEKLSGLGIYMWNPE